MERSPKQSHTSRYGCFGLHRRSPALQTPPPQPFQQVHPIPPHHRWGIQSDTFRFSSSCMKSHCFPLNTMNRERDRLLSRISEKERQRGGSPNLAGTSASKAAPWQGCNGNNSEKKKKMRKRSLCIGNMNLKLSKVTNAKKLPHRSDAQASRGWLTFILTNITISCLPSLPEIL